MAMRLRRDPGGYEERSRQGWRALMALTAEEDELREL